MLLYLRDLVSYPAKYFWNVCLCELCVFLTVYRDFRNLWNYLSQSFILGLLYEIKKGLVEKTPVFLSVT
jgi:uncharacterized protein (DUF2225 family)